MSIVVDSVSWVRGSKRVLQNISFEVEKASICALVGPNGAGKSSLLHVLTGATAPSKGSITINGTPISKYSRTQQALVRALVPQQHALGTQLSVIDVVTGGRFALHKGYPTDSDLEAAWRALELVEAEHLATNMVNKLSGGEGQRVAIARALAQLDHKRHDGMQVLLLDEPTANLDPKLSQTIVRVVQYAATTQNMCVVVSLHDLSVVAQVATQCVALHKGQISCAGNTEDVLADSRLSACFGVQLHVMKSPLTNRTLVEVAAQ